MEMEKEHENLSIKEKENLWIKETDRIAMEKQEQTLTYI